MASKPAFKFPFTRKTTAAPALPMGAPPVSSAAIVPVTPATPARFSFGNFAKRRRSRPAPTSIAVRGAQARDIVRSDARGETLGSIFAKSLAPGVGASFAGVLDETPVSKAIEEATDGAVNLSDVALILGGLARGAELDGKVPLVGTYLKRANTSFLTGTLPAKFYMAGRAGGKRLWGKDTAKANSKTQKKSEEMVPGEATTA